MAWARWDFRCFDGWTRRRTWQTTRGGGCWWIGHRAPAHGAPRRPSVHSDRNDLRDAGLLHRHPVKYVSGLHGSFVMRNHDELRMITHFTDQAREAADVRVVEWRIHLVQEAERRRVDEEQREDQADGNQRLLTTREQRHRIETLARGPNDDLYAGLQQVVLVRQNQMRLAAANSRGKTVWKRSFTAANVSAKRVREARLRR